MSKFENIDINNVFFDIHNPRSKYSSENEVPEGADVFDQQSQETLIPNTLKLSEGINGKRDSIISCNGIRQPIIVKTKDNKYISIDGNSRVMIYKKLYDEAETEEEKQKWSTIPAQVFGDITAKEEAEIKLTAHLVGTREWKPYNKAKYIEELIETGHSWEEITDVIGSNKSEIMRLWKAVARFDKYLFPKIQNRDERKFSLYFESQTEPIQNVMKKHFSGENEAEDKAEKIFAKWVAENKLKMAINVRKLPLILENPDAKDAFLRGGYDEALPFTMPAGVVETSLGLEQLIQETRDKILSLDFETLKENPLYFELLNDLIKDIEHVQANFQEKLE